MIESGLSFVHISPKDEELLDAVTKLQEGQLKIEEIPGFKRKMRDYEQWLPEFVRDGEDYVVKARHDACFDEIVSVRVFGFSIPFKQRLDFNDRFTVDGIRFSPVGHVYEMCEAFPRGDEPYEFCQVGKSMYPILEHRKARNHS
jgi:hypothetical protein